MWRKTILYIIILLMFTSCHDINDNEQILTPPDIDTKSDIDESHIIGAIDYTKIVDMLNQELFAFDRNTLLNGVTTEDIFQFSEEVRGNPCIITGNENICPPGLIEILEKTLHDLCSYISQGLSVEDSNYFDIINTFGAEKIIFDFDKEYALVPEEMKRNFINRFSFRSIAGEDIRITAESSGGSYGHVIVSMEKKIEDDFVFTCAFETQNYGYGRVIEYENSFYYVFLHYNYLLKNYDGIKLHALDSNPETENIIIKYLPEVYAWKNIYSEQSPYNTDIIGYIDSIREIITSDDYLENGLAEGAYAFYGDEIDAPSFILTNDFNCYYKIDFANTGIPVYIRKSHLIPSSISDIWELRAEFYIHNLQLEAVIELDNLEIGGSNWASPYKLVQLWFKEINEKVITFQIYHISNYNYLLNVTLIEGDHVTILRTDIFSPERKFVLTENDSFFYG